MSPESAFSAALAMTPGDSEKIGLARIRMRHAGENVTVIVRSFREANKLLLDWAARADGCFECELQVLYMDGRVFGGGPVRWHRKAGRPSLSEYVRASFQQTQVPTHFPSRREMREMAIGAHQVGRVQHASALMGRYETDD
jgi:hypothetical protein